MKKLLFALLLMLPVIGLHAQEKIPYGKTRADYEAVLAKFVEYYNHNQPEDIKTLLSPKWGAEKEAWSDGTIKMLKLQLGNVVSTSYVGPLGLHRDIYGNPMVYFKLLFTKAAVADKKWINGKKDHPVSISLDENGKILAISFVTSIFYVENLVVQY